MSGNSFYCHRVIKATRKPHVCEQCGRRIEIGSPSHYRTGVWEGHFYAEHAHVECHEAAWEYATLNDLWGEEFPWFQHMDDRDHHDWLLEKHPIVAGRLNIIDERTAAAI
jgi:hypothetical protein